MATPALNIRKKRNFKTPLTLNVTAELPPPPAPVPAPVPEPIPTRAAPAAGGKKRPPPMKLAAPKVAPSGHVPVPDSGVESSGLTIDQTPVSALHSSERAHASHRNTYHTTLSNTLASLDMNAETKYDLKNEDLKELRELGQGNGGSVKQVEHTPTGTIMAKKIVLIDAKPSVRKQILRELQILHNCNSPYIISFHGAFLADPNICICMEFADKGSLDGIYKKIGPIDIDVVSKVALAVLEGLTYLYDVHRIIHRDIKPSNILCNSRGQIKICDFGVSGELINSIADTFVGTSTYMSPERIQGAQYTVKSDVWSLGVSLIELAMGRFPFTESDEDDSDLSDLEGTLSPSRPRPLSSRLDIAKSPATSKRDKRKSKGVSLQGGGMTMSILELLQHIVNEPAPKLTPAGHFPPEADEFTNSCLLKDPDARLNPQALLQLKWMDHARTPCIDLEQWASTF